MEIYVVQAGDTLQGIAQRFGVSIESLIYQNQLIEPYGLAVGQSLVVGEPDTGEREGRRVIISGGYAYPFISPWVLEQTLPYLTELYIFSYGFTAEGDLVPPPLDDEWMIREAVTMGSSPYLTLTPFGPDGQFNNNLISAIVNNPEASQRLLASLAAVMEQKGYEGLDIDFEFIYASDRDAFTAFVRDAAAYLNPLGYEVSVALAPKSSADQPGLLYEGKDYAALGAVANHVLVMTYEWGYTYSVPMAVAPVNLVRRVIEYAVTEIPPDKISLGIPNYGYDWTLPYVRGVTRARTIGNIEAVQLAVRYGAAIQYDEVAQTPHFNYFDEMGREHEVWFEDARSMRAKYALIEEFGLRGIGCWQVMQLFRAMWLVLADRYWIE
ncbi:MAG: LysM peptidoglycan-binding domain-containing protein [Lachnospiraceae bacterium]|nr:LysM peptidoglycan-binding domain-containing protein [Lachnospiraceae bacterium]